MRLQTVIVKIGQPLVPLTSNRSITVVWRLLSKINDLCMITAIEVVGVYANFMQTTQKYL